MPLCRPISPLENSLVLALQGAPWGKIPIDLLPGRLPLCIGDSGHDGAWGLFVLPSFLKKHICPHTASSRSTSASAYLVCTWVGYTADLSRAWRAALGWGCGFEDKPE
ncbi:unnamed protein product [Rangifer tarandus platyrhynchus]|uniref:Uncharacterized protein n=2 Tax=Rangifer tarandus platyrhynchus TaxID=3082113 RepID=A0ABN8XQH4_RANTA|nr:unnamed protein product [Rangifer tarandus platyrhynchus]